MCLFLYFYSFIRSLSRSFNNGKMCNQWDWNHGSSVYPSTNVTSQSRPSIRPMELLSIRFARDIVSGSSGPSCQHGWSTNIAHFLCRLLKFAVCPQYFAQRGGREPGLHVLNNFFKKLDSFTHTWEWAHRRVKVGQAGKNGGSAVLLHIKSNVWASLMILTWAF